ncbi:FapA family protein [Desulfocurvus sp.]|uniref:FapA family protein n=1 Tax=Desulfocurvus sp. TaxID=2871698 RepID=UPI0025BCEE1F|nr:FapA family protein [Desulfocurvus sp.]MCK9238964.1 FapA family protein [Desulfocurvus sp.]
MPYYLKHFFDPGFDYTDLRPRELADGSVDHYNRGYVQNVERGQVLARWLDEPPPPDEGAAPDPWSTRAYEEKVFPAGNNTMVDLARPDELLAAEAGYVFYLDGRITVKKTLNVRRDVDFHTGNISFLGNVVVHGSVRAGFQVQGLNVLVRQTVEGALIRARESFQAEGGVKGGGKAAIKAGANFRVPFAENAMLLAGGRMLVDGPCMHCDVYAGEQLAVKGRLVGGKAVCTRVIYVGGQLGGGMGAETVLILGYDAILLNRSHLVEAKVAETLARLEEARALAAKHPQLRGELAPKVALLEERLHKFRERHRELWQGIRAVENLEACRVVVPGKVHPGVEVCIGEACLEVDDFMENVFFTYADHEVVVGKPALKK